MHVYKSNKCQCLYWIDWYTINRKLFQLPSSLLLLLLLLLLLSWCLEDAKTECIMGYIDAPIWLPQSCYLVTSVSYNWVVLKRTGSGGGGGGLIWKVTCISSFWTKIILMVHLPFNKKSTLIVSYWTECSIALSMHSPGSCSISCCTTSSSSRSDFGGAIAAPPPIAETEQIVKITCNMYRNQNLTIAEAWLLLP